MSKWLKKVLWRCCTETTIFVKVAFNLGRGLPLPSVSKNRRTQNRQLNVLPPCKISVICKIKTIMKKKKNSKYIFLIYDMSFAWFNWMIEWLPDAKKNVIGDDNDNNNKFVITSFLTGLDIWITIKINKYYK